MDLLPRTIAEVKQCWSVTVASRWLYLQSLAPTNPQWGRVGGYGPFSSCVIHKACALAVGKLIG
jgi:hypothetical protein